MHRGVEPVQQAHIPGFAQLGAQARLLKVAARLEASEQASRSGRLGLLEPIGLRAELGEHHIQVADFAEHDAQMLQRLPQPVGPRPVEHRAGRPQNGP